MRSLHVAALAALVATAATAAIATASGGAPPADPPAPALRTVVSHGSGAGAVVAPARRSDLTIERAVAAARAKALPRAVAAARDEAARLAAAAGMTLGRTIGIARDAPPSGWYDPDSGRFGPGRWCGTVGRAGKRRRTCHAPTSTSTRVTLTVEAG